MARSLFGSVIQTPSGNYRGRYRVEGTDYYTATCRTKTQVRKLLAEIHADMIRGDWQPPNKAKNAAPEKLDLTFEQWFNQWIEQVIREGFSPNTTRSYKSAINNHILPRYADMKLTELTPELFETLWRDLKKTKAPKTASNILVAASTCLGWAVKEGYIETNPVQVEGIFGRQRSIRKPVILTAKQLNRLISRIRPDLQAAFVFLSWCALRPGEVPPLLREDIDLKGETVTVNKAVKREDTGRIVVGPPKSEASHRTVAIPSAQMHIVADHLNNYTPASPESLVFFQPRSPYSFVSDDTLRRQLSAATKKAGLPTMQVYDLRRTGLTLYGQAGATIADLMARAGHTDAETVMIYQKATARRDKELSNRM